MDDRFNIKEYLMSWSLEMEVFEKCNEMFENCSSCARELYIEAILSEKTSEAILKEFREFIVNLSERNKNSDLEDIFIDVLDGFDCSELRMKSGRTGGTGAVGATGSALRIIAWVG